MFESITNDGIHTIITGKTCEVKITPKIYGGYTLTKTIKDHPFNIIEKREIFLPLSEKAIIEEAKTLLMKNYGLFDGNNYTIQPI